MQGDRSIGGFARQSFWGVRPARLVPIHPWVDSCFANVLKPPNEAALEIRRRAAFFLALGDEGLKLSPDIGIHWRRRIFLKNGLGYLIGAL